ncbi:allophanate hydrolase, partial [Rhizobium leguminosarum]
GERLAILPGHWGSWTYLAFAGHIEAKTWLGSMSTHSLSGLGGGRLAAGQTLTRSSDRGLAMTGHVIGPFRSSRTSG